MEIIFLFLKNAFIFTLLGNSLSNNKPSLFITFDIFMFTVLQFFQQSCIIEYIEKPGIKMNNIIHEGYRIE